MNLKRVFCASYKTHFLVLIFISCVIKLSITAIERDLEVPCGVLYFENDTESFNTSLSENETENENFSRLRRSLGKATKLVLYPAESSVVTICGYHTDISDGYTNHPCKCKAHNVTKTTTYPYWLDSYTMTSTSCAREKSPAEYCKSTFCEDISTENLQCAILYQETNCQSCHYNGIYLQSGEVFHTLYSSHILSLAVRRNCQVKRTLGGFVGNPAKDIFFNGTTYHNTLLPLRYLGLEPGPTFTCTCSDDQITTTDITAITTEETTYSSTEITEEYRNTTTEKVETTTKRVQEFTNYVRTLKIIGIITVGVIVLIVVLAFVARKVVWIQREKICIKGIKFLGCPENGPTSQNASPTITMHNSEDIPLHNLIINEAIGHGNFGVVSKGTMKLANGKWIKVAVKMLKPSCDDSNVKNTLLNEIKVMQHVGYHPNILQLIGHCTVSPEKFFMIGELCNKGTLEEFLIDKRRIRINVDDIEKQSQTCSGYTRLGVVTSNYSKIGEATKNSHLLSLMLKWSSEIAAGMNYLSSRNVVHIDLAIRNILLTDDLTAKIADFGLSRKMYLTPTYTKRMNDEPLPFRTMSPESLEHNEFGESSDVWSYGVTLWEIFSFAETPFRNVNNDFQLLQLLKTNYRLHQPQFLRTTPEIYENLILPCWNINPKQRPTFKDLQILLEEYLKKY